jgi:hypothetical protein
MHIWQARQVREALFEETSHSLELRVSTETSPRIHKLEGRNCQSHLCVPRMAGIVDKPYVILVASNYA